jgi:hypothetical protein
MSERRAGMRAAQFEKLGNRKKNLFCNAFQLPKTGEKK